ncbi:MAG: class I SAM-dependent methyltransferase [Candidatus Paceibacterota bacterium]|jgi:hypothetical protein
MRYLQDINKKQVDGLTKLCSYLKNSDVIVEIGSYAGHSSLIFANHVKHISCVDPWLDQDWCKIYKITPKDLGAFWSFPMSEVEKEFDNKMSAFKNFTKLKMTSKEASKLYNNESLDFVYIDGLHTYDAVKEDFSLWYPKIKKTGYIGGHDFQYPPVKKAIIDCLGQPKEIFIDFSWIIKVK